MKKDSYQILDGHNRAEILKELNYQEAWCEVWDIDERQANIFLATANRLRGTDDIQKRIRLIGEIYQEFGEDKNLLLRLLPETEKSLNSLLKMAEADVNEVMDDLEMERGVIEDQLSQIVDPEEAERMAKVYKQFPDGNYRLTFVFEDVQQYESAKKFFSPHGEPDISILLKIVSDYGK